MKLVPQIVYDDLEYQEIIGLKMDMESNWHDFLLDLVRFKRAHEVKE